MSKRTCDFDGCDNKVVARGWCTKHYQRWSKYGDPAITRPRVRGTCTIQDCEKPAYGHGYCNLHWQRWRKHGDPEYVRPKRFCSIEGCDRSHYAKGYCASHWKQQFRGEPVRELTGIAIPFEERLWARIDKSGPEFANLGNCWLWTGYVNPDGYGKLRADGLMQSAHRYVFQMFNGQLDDGVEVDHVCFVTNCVNPKHLRRANRKQQNEYRQGPQKHSKTGVRGVYKTKNRFKKFGGVVGHNGKSVHVGYFHTLEEAREAVRAKRAELYSHDNPNS